MAPFRLHGEFWEYLKRPLGIHRHILPETLICVAPETQRRKGVKEKILNKIALDTKLKTLLLVPVLLLSAVAFLGTIPVLPVFATANLSISPAVLSDTCLPPSPGSGCTSGLGVGAMFQYTVTASGIGGDTGTVFAYQYEIHYDPTILQAVSVDSFGPFFDALVGGGNAVPVTSIDNANGVVVIAVSSTGPSTFSFTTTLVVGQVTFSVAGLGRSDQTLQNAILLHNAGGGVLANIPVTTSIAIFSNTGLFGRADFPSLGSGIRRAWPEEVNYAILQDTSFHPGIVDLFANVNSTGTLPVVVFIRFTLTSDFGNFVANTPTHQYDPGEVSVVPQVAGYNPNPTGNQLLVGTYNVQAQVFYQEVRLDGTLGAVTPGVTIKPFRFTVMAGLPTTTTVSCSPTSVHLNSTCTAVVSSSDPASKLTGSVSFASSGPSTDSFKPASCTLFQGVCSVKFIPTASGSATVTASYSGDISGKDGHLGSTGATTVAVVGHPTMTVVSCSPTTINAPRRETTTCTVTVTDTSGTPVTPIGEVFVTSSKKGTLSPLNPATDICAVSSDPCNKATVSLSPIDARTASGTFTYMPCPPGTFVVCSTGSVTFSTTYSGDKVGDGHLRSYGTTNIAVTGHTTTTTLKCSLPSLGHPLFAFEPTLCTATVTDGSASPVTPTGTVSFTAFNGQLTALKQGDFSPSNRCTLSATEVGIASCSVTFTPTSTDDYNLRARYSGDTVGDGHVRSQVRIRFTVSLRTTTTTVVCSPSTVAINQATTCTATVTDTVGSAVSPKGTVTFTSSVGTSTFSATSCTLSGSTASVTCSVTYTQTDTTTTATITATYDGDGAHATSSGTTTVTVT